MDGEDSHEHRAAVDDEDDRGDDRVQDAMRHGPCREDADHEVGEVAEDESGGADRQGAGPCEQPRSDPADHGGDRRHRPEPARALRGDQAAQDCERHGVRDEVAPRRVEERCEDDARQVREVPGTDPEHLESARQEHVRELDRPHERDEDERWDEARSERRARTDALGSVRHLPSIRHGAGGPVRVADGRGGDRPLGRVRTDA